MSTFKEQESKNLAQLANIRGKIHGLTGLNLVQPNRRFIYEGDVDKVSAASGIINTRHIFLFNDLLIYGSVKQKGTLYEYSDHIFVSNLILKDISFKSASKFGFQLVRNDDTKQRDYIMLCRSMEEKQVWMQHLKFVISESKTITEPQQESKSLSPSNSKTKLAKVGFTEGIMKAAMIGNMDVISQHLKEGFDLALHDPSTGQTILHKISHAGHSILLHLLLESYVGNIVSLVNAKDFYGATALHYAANGGRVDCLKALISYNADRDLCDDGLANSLHYASRSGHLDSVSLLLDSSSPDLVLKKDSQGLTAAGYAAFHGHTSVLCALLNQMRLFSNKIATASPSLSRRNVNFSTSLPSEHCVAIAETLHLAAMNGNIECMKEIIQMIEGLERDQGAQLGGVNAKDKLGMAAAHHAALSGILSSLSLLHERGADMQARDNTGGTILHAACTGGSIECVRYLIKKLSSTKADFMSKDSGGMTPLHRAIVAGQLALVWEILNSEMCTETLVNMKDARGQTALHIASESKWGGCALLLINIGKADVTIRDDDSYTPLHIAMKAGAKEIVSYIANAETEITKKEADLLLQLGKQHKDCAKIVARIAGVMLLDNLSISSPTMERSSSISSISEDLIDGSDVDSDDGSDSENSDSDDEYDDSSKKEIKQRVVEIWGGVRDNQLLSNLYLETVRNLYRLPQDGDFGVTYWTYVNNFVQKVSMNPATDRGLLALRRDLNLDFLDHHRLVKSSSSSSLNLLASNPEEKPLLQRTVATRRIPLGPSSPNLPSSRSILGLRAPSATSIPLPSATPSSTLQTTSSKSGSRIISLPSPTQAPPSPSFLSAPISTAPAAHLSLDPPAANRRATLLSPSVSLGSFSALLADSNKKQVSSSQDSAKNSRVPEIKELEELEDLDVSSLKPKTILTQHQHSTDSSNHLRHKINHSSNEDGVKKVDLDKEALLRMLSSKVKHTSNPDAFDIASALEVAANKESYTRLSVGKKSNSAPKLITTEDDSRHRSSKSRLKDERRNDNGEDHVTTPRGEEANSTFPLAPRESSTSSRRISGERRPIKVSVKPTIEDTTEHSGLPTVPEQIESADSWDSVWKSKRKSDANFWENAIKTPSSNPTTPSHEAPPPPFQDALVTPHVVAPTRFKKVRPPKLEIPTGDSTESKISDINDAIDQLNTPTQEHKRRPISRTISSWRTTKRVVLLDKKREEQIVAVLQGHGVSPNKLKEAIEAADCSVLVPGLLSALSPILPSTKEAAICVDQHFSDLELSDLSGLSDRELSQIFVVQMASIPRVHQRVESLIARSDFEMKASVISNMIKSHFIICSELTTNARLKEIIEILLSHVPKNKNADAMAALHRAIEELQVTVPNFIDVMARIVGKNTAKDTSAISAAWTDLQYGVTVSRQECAQCPPSDPLVSLLTEFIAEAEPEVEQLQSQIDVWDTISIKVGYNLGDLAVYVEGQHLETDRGGDLIICMCNVFETIINMLKRDKVIEHAETVERDKDRTKTRLHKNRKHKRRNIDNNNNGPAFSRGNLKGEKILQPELTPLRVTFNAYKDFCAKTSKVKRKTYTFLKNQNKPQQQQQQRYREEN